MDLQFTRLDPIRVLARDDRIIEIYRQAYAGPPYEKSRQEVEDFSRSLEVHVQDAGFRFIAAQDRESDQLIGFTYGRKVDPRFTWVEVVSKSFDDRTQRDWLEDAFQLVEISILPDYQGAGIGGNLHDTLLDGLPFRRALLTTIHAESRAMRLYRSRGWSILTGSIRPPGILRDYCLMGLELDKQRYSRLQSQPSD